MLGLQIHAFQELDLEVAFHLPEVRRSHERMAVLAAFRLGLRQRPRAAPIVLKSFFII